MKYAVHVTTRDEQDYVSMKLNNEIYGNRWNYITNDNDIFDDYANVIDKGYEIISFEEFKSRYELKIGDTFVYNGFVCEVKEKIEEKNWYRIIDKLGNLYFEKMPKERTEQAVDYKVKSIIEITNKEFIKQLEENAR